jgi:hypothetical protein
MGLPLGFWATLARAVTRRIEKSALYDLLVKLADSFDRLTGGLLGQYAVGTGQGSGGTGFELWGPAPGTLLPDSDTTVNVSTGSIFVQKGPTTGNRQTTIGTSGSPVNLEIVQFVRTDTSAHTWAILNGGTGGGTLFTAGSGEKWAVWVQWLTSGTHWVLLGAQRWDNS